MGEEGRAISTRRWDTVGLPLAALVAPVCCIGLPLLLAAGVGVLTLAIAGAAFAAGVVLVMIAALALRAGRRSS